MVEQLIIVNRRIYGYLGQSNTSRLSWRSHKCSPSYLLGRHFDRGQRKISQEQRNVVWDVYIYKLANRKQIVIRNAGTTDAKLVTVSYAAQDDKWDQFINRPLGDISANSEIKGFGEGTINSSLTDSSDQPWGNRLHMLLITWESELGNRGSAKFKPTDFGREGEWKNVELYSERE